VRREPSQLDYAGPELAPRCRSFLARLVWRDWVDAYLLVTAGFIASSPGWMPRLGRAMMVAG
jgi:hypothetical protein